MMNRILILVVAVFLSSCASTSGGFDRDFGWFDGHANGRRDRCMGREYDKRDADADGDGQVDTDDYSGGWVEGYDVGYSRNMRSTMP